MADRGPCRLAARVWPGPAPGAPAGTGPVQTARQKATRPWWMGPHCSIASPPEASLWPTPSGSTSRNPPSVLGPGEAARSHPPRRVAAGRGPTRLAGVTAVQPPLRPLGPGPDRAGPLPTPEPHGMSLRGSADRSPRAVVGKGQDPIRGPAGPVLQRLQVGPFWGRSPQGRHSPNPGKSELGWGRSGREWSAAGVAGGQRPWVGQGPEFSGCRQRLPCGPLPRVHCRVFRRWARERPPVDRAAGSQGGPVALRRLLRGENHRLAGGDGAGGAIRLFGRSVGRLGASATFCRGAAPGSRGAA
jgi:hypothetical protein